MVFSLFNLVIGLLGTGVFAGMFLLINRWQKHEPFLVSVFSWVGLAGIIAGLAFSLAGAVSAVAVNAVGLFVLLVLGGVLSVFAIIGAQQACPEDSKIRDFAYLVCGIIFSLVAGFAVLVAAGFASGMVPGVVVPLLIGWVVTLFVWLVHDI